MMTQRRMDRDFVMAGIRMPRQTHRALRMLAFERNTSLQQQVLEAVAAHMERFKAEENGREPR